MEIIFVDHSTRHVLDHVLDGVFDHALIEAQCEAFLNCQQHVLAVSVVDGQVVGMISAVVFFHPDKSPQLWINELSVAPPVRRQGIGRELMKAMFVHAESRGCRSAGLATHTDNEAARQLYRNVRSSHQSELVEVHEWSI